MRVGIDAKWYFNGHPSGKVVVENIVNHIVKKDSTVDFYIFLSKKDRHLKFPIEKPNIHLVYIPNFLNAFTNIFIMPFYTSKYNLDVCMYQNYAPLFGAKKIVNYVHDALFMDFPEFFSLKERIYFYPMKYLSKCADHVITISYSEKERMLKHGFCEDKNISVVYHGLGLANKKQFLNKVNIFDKYNLPNKFILYLGRLNVRKNIQNLIKALPLVSEEVSLVIVGKSDHKTFDLDQLTDSLKVKDRVVKVGYIQFEDIEFFYKNAFVFCFPSFAEGFGLPPLEAMHYGTPVVVSNKTSLPEVCGDSALYIDPNKPSEIANQVNLLLNSQSLRNKLIKKGKQRSSEFSWEKASSEILNILKTI
ncbi:glycosyltransferase family 4 protein [Winogradskyella aquimaris]|uniref:Glycosyltransferase family 1 protein n=1 Tax=Winogradskyella aquimaris TaxID=864074 RepID=A0ABU5EJE6_9FLAO|nr:glycosyltransferase family 1 protein [Winogradskyella aquimaris]MDY2586476.1 glycosyltransferase family 1 protein [Winogradskyella aquimaris]